MKLYLINSVLALKNVYCDGLLLTRGLTGSVYFIEIEGIIETVKRFSRNFIQGLRI